MKLLYFLSIYIFPKMCPTTLSKTKYRTSGLFGDIR